MSTAEKNSLYNQIIDVTSDYLGPATKRFIDRQIENHLHKKPESVTKKDLSTLSDWMVSVVTMLTEDKKVIKEYSNRLKMLGSGK